jgi:hypothetical protein
MAVTGLGTRTIKMVTADETVTGPLQIQAIQWSSLAASRIAAADALLLSRGSAVEFEELAEVGKLGGFWEFKVPKKLAAGETLTLTTLGHGAVYLHVV